MKQLFICLLMGLCCKAQTGTDTETINKMKDDIKTFFIKKGEIDDNNKLGIAAFDICDGTDIDVDAKEKGIYIIRTVYRTNGTDYLFFKNGNTYEILDFQNLELIVSKTFELFDGQTDEEMYNQLKCLLEWYDGSYLYKIKNSKKIYTVKRE